MALSGFASPLLRNVVYTFFIHPCWVKTKRRGKAPAKRGLQVVYTAHHLKAAREREREGRERAQGDRQALKTSSA